MAQDSYQDRDGTAIPADLAMRLISHLRLDEMRELLSADGICESCPHLYLFHDEEAYEACRVQDCECATE